MHTIKLPATKLEFYDDPAHLPIIRYYEYQFYFTLALSLSLESVPSMFNEVERYIADDAKDKAIKQLHNIRINFMTALQKSEAKALCIGQLIHKIDDRIVDFTNNEAQLKECLATLSKKGFTQELVNQIFDSSKKKFAPDWNFAD